MGTLEERVRRRMEEVMDEYLLPPLHRAAFGSFVRRCIADGRNDKVGDMDTHFLLTQLDSWIGLHGVLCVCSPSISVNGREPGEHPANGWMD